MGLARHLAVTSAGAIRPLQVQASPYSRKLAAPSRRNRFVILQAAPSPPVALHPVLADSAVTFGFMWCDSHMAQTPTVLTRRPHGRTTAGLRPARPDRAHLCALMTMSEPEARGP